MKTVRNNIETKIDPRERLRRRRERLIIIITSFLIVALTFLESYFSKTRGKLPITNNLIIYLLLNINILLLILLIFLVIRNIVKLIFERRRGILGSRLRTKLVASFVGLTIIPTLLLFWISASFITNTIDNWFSLQLERSLEKSLEVAQTYYQNLSLNALSFAENLSNAISKENLLTVEQEGTLRTLVDTKLHEYNVGVIEILPYPHNQGSVLLASQLDIETNLGIEPALIKQGLTGKPMSKIESLGRGDLIRGLSPIRSAVNSRKIVGLVVVSYYIPRGIVKKMTRISEAFTDYKRLKLTQSPIKANYIITLSIVTLIIIFSAIMYGFHLAKNITGPIQDLAEGTLEVANGNLDVHIHAHNTDDEIGGLVESFNKMTHDLKTGKVQLEEINKNLNETNIELDQRRKYMEIIVKNVAAGVISLDSDGRITTINKSVGKILGLEVDSVLNRNYRDILPPQYLEQVDNLLREFDRLSTLTFEKEITLSLPTKNLDLSIYITPLKDERGDYLGLVIVIEDVTQIQKAQRVAAWREVARRIAHEIKNPLTPIQLSAQRLRRRYKDRFSEDGRVFDECTNTIITQVEILKNMVNEFYNFARMPSTKPSPNDLNQIINETIPIYREAHRDIIFNFMNSETLPVLKLDKSQIKRALINILDNAVAAIGTKGQVTIETFCDTFMEIAGVEIADDGCGVPPAEKSRLFEPYFSTKKSGTGLGLTIVNSIISDHHGYIRVRDNHPKGTIFRIELPVRP